MGDFLVSEAKRFGVETLTVLDGGRDSVARVLFVSGRWRDDQRFSHDEMYVNNLSQNVVDTALATFLSSAFRERVQRSEIILPGEQVRVQFLDGTPDYIVKLSPRSPAVFIGESISLFSPSVGHPYGDAVLSVVVPSRVIAGVAALP